MMNQSNCSLAVFFLFKISGLDGPTDGPDGILVVLLPEIRFFFARAKTADQDVRNFLFRRCKRARFSLMPEYL